MNPQILFIKTINKGRYALKHINSCSGKKFLRNTGEDK